ncbi:DUF5709 domain-containing protein [Propionicicella superfundia]|uniref:DUF5709 domain-containing protein n=1 Tax=Propionicicella superfundia TaxID=348582 RepID=UPI000426F8CA|nr:DUF5709 domain-containing protein [Propionicicella superfundia]
MTDYDPTMPDESEQLDQLQPDETMIDRGVADILDEGLTVPENWSPAQGYGNTPAEMRQGETLDQRVVQEIPEPAPAVEPPAPWNPDPTERREVGSRRSGRLVDANEGYPGEDSEAQAVGHDVGLSGGAATAEEAAMHVIDEFEESD